MIDPINMSVQCDKQQAAPALVADAMPAISGPPGQYASAQKRKKPNESPDMEGSRLQQAPVRYEGNRPIVAASCSGLPVAHAMPPHGDAVCSPCCACALEGKPHSTPPH